MKIEKYLILNKYLLSLFGVNELRELQEKLKDAQVGIDSDGRSHFINVLRSLGNLKISESDLLRYDQNIQSYVKKINFKRQQINLKYFQYLAVLFTEIFLDNLKNKKLEFLFNLNQFLKDYKKEEGIDLIDPFTESDFKKLAFWMATGSGKTLIMHINYYQFFKYNLFSPDNIILITPNEGLSKQHFEELEKSGIPCRLYSGSFDTESKRDKEVLVIEITKLVEEKKGSGVTLPVETFEGKNLIFVDEGHKGQARDNKEEMKWKRRRDLLAEKGFTFEYSATFGQILSVPSSRSKNKKASDNVFEEYAKSIIFDYSYKYFYLDGYGKDFSILNVKETGISEKEFQEAMFLANLLSFYEQILIYEEYKEKARQYNLEKPLWIFVGTTVIKEKKRSKRNSGELNEEEKATISDVIQIIEFIKKVIENEEWVNNWIDKILRCDTGLKDESDKDIFSDRFYYLRKNEININNLYELIFCGKGRLNLYELKNAQGEIGLKIGENPYFGVVNIGDVASLKKRLEERGISVEQDVISASLFDDIKRENSKINILIGSKKFIEGWDTWRVSCMGLLNIGRGQGPQIIQLFGRGVRLKGKGMSLKRSGENSEIRLLETLNIYGIKADYLNKFLEAINKEEVELETIKIPIQYQHRDKWETLYTFSKSEKKFEENIILKLEIDDKISYTVDLLPEVQVTLSQDKREEGIKAKGIKSEVVKIGYDDNVVNLLDWQKIYQEIYYFKVQKGYWNLVFDTETLKKILLSSRYTLLCSPEIFELKNAFNIKKLEEIAILIIKKYLDLFYKKNLRKFETKELRYDKVKQLPLPFVSEDEQGYIVQIDKKKKDLINKIRKLTQDLNKILKEEFESLPRIYFDRSLYVPILLESKKINKISPPGLVESEKKFVEELRKYLSENSSRFSSVEIYLLRNFSKIGVGFQLEWSGFYPDFIMWIKRGEKQVIIFIDPHGLGHVKSLNNEKIVFAGFKPADSDIITIKDIEFALNNKNISIESFILSPTKYDDLRKREIDFPSKEKFIQHHVLFLEDSNWPEVLFNTDSIKEILNSK
ncbi:MAG: DEAD/DEAH box helicase family protein [Candidatus Hydrothermales bacterium]